MLELNDAGKLHHAVSNQFRKTGSVSAYCQVPVFQQCIKTKLSISFWYVQILLQLC
jgi:hypothetical protein